MAYRLFNSVVTEVEAPEVCAFCNEKKEIRPYGPNGESICFSCAMRDEKQTKQQFGKLFTANH